MFYNKIKMFYNKIYIMAFSIFGISISIEMLILLGVVYLIIIVNTLTSCCNMNGIMEGFELNGLIGGTDAIVKDAAKQAKEGFRPSPGNILGRGQYISI